MKQQFTLITVVIIALIGLLSVLQVPDEEPPIETDPHFVDAYIRDFTMVSMNENGKPIYTLSADLMERYNDTGESEITQPVFNINKDDQAWVITARHGLIDDDKIWVTLRDDVVMLQKDVITPLKLTTSKLRLNTQTQVADTDQKVDIIQGSMSIKSNGMEFNNLTGNLELLDGVKGIYVKD
ncbi:MAG: LPS export ABC transporter periplasmic protein LptC [Gammaproteobacteria bacterium]|nr:LPS export ABC transporter periplasmic protein LptC [Gammaproteobacteria bacterium]NNJ97187.1 LPS export ABC transporter periplasmic protein LptC [Gammaproteobacteria bacterium]